MSFDLTSQKVKDTYQNLCQVSGASIVNGLGAAVPTLTVPSASYSPVEPNYSSSVSTAKQNALVTGGTYAITASWANSSNTAPANASASYLSGAVAIVGNTTGNSITATTTAGTAVDARASTTGYGVYAQGLVTEAIAGVQTGILSGDVNRGVVSVTRQILGAQLNGFDTVAAVLTVENVYDTGSAPLITAETAGTEVFKVDRTGSLYSSGSMGFTGTVNISGGFSMSFQGGVFIGATT